MARARGSWWARLVLGAGFLFLYAPIIVLMIYSFNESRLVTVWAGFSTRWYGELFRNEQILGAAWMSVRIAFLSATAALLFGTLASVAMARFGRFRGKTLLTGMLTAPLVMPEVITGLSLLLLFVTLAQLVGWPAERGMLTIWIAHTTFNMAYVTVVVSARLREFDRSLEEAAMDLGANRLAVFFRITLPIIAPALFSGWLLAFTLSLDDLVIASFVSGPGATTLPMAVFSSVRRGVSPEINALATILVSLVASVSLLSWWLMRRREVQRMQDRQRAATQ